MTEINQNDIFPARKVISAKEVETNVKAETGIPLGYVPVTFTSKDKLGPAVLHFRNYSMGEIYEIASANEQKQHRILTQRVLNKMCYEKYDCTQLHVENVKQIMLTIYANFWGNSLKSRPYYIDENRADIDNKDNIAYTDILISKINQIDIDDTVKNSISVTFNNTKVSFCFPTIEHTFIAEDYQKKTFEKEEKKFASLQSKLRVKEELESKKMFDEASNIEIDTDLLNEYEDYQAESQALFLKVMQAETLTALNNKKLETLDEKLEAFDNPEITIDFWAVYNNALEKYKFGIDDSYTFKNDKGVDLVRRFSFRLVDLLPSMEQKDYTAYNIHFDD